MMEEELDLREVFLILRKRIKIILLITVLAMLISGVISYYILPPVYKASTSLIISRAQNITINNQIQLQDIQTSRMLAATYSEIVKSRRVLEPVVTKLNLPMSEEDLKGKIDVTSKDNTEIIEISVRDNNPERAAEIANAIASSFMDNIVKIMKIDNVQVIDRAVPPTSKVSPKTSLNVVIAGVLGLMMSIFLVFLLEYMDRTVKTPDDIKKYLNLPVLGIIPEVKNK